MDQESSIGEGKENYQRDDPTQIPEGVRPETSVEVGGTRHSPLTLIYTLLRGVPTYDTSLRTQVQTEPDKGLFLRLRRKCQKSLNILLAREKESQRDDPRGLTGPFNSSPFTPDRLALTPTQTHGKTGIHVKDVQPHFTMTDPSTYTPSSHVHAHTYTHTHTSRTVVHLDVRPQVGSE